MNRLAGLLGVIVTAGLVVLGAATPALAHNSLIGSSPTDGAQLAAGPGKIDLTFDQPVLPGAEFNSIAVIGPNNDHWEAGPAQVASNIVSAEVRPLGPAGEYRIGYRVLSADGHPVSGELTFTLTTAGNGTPAAPEAPTPGDTATPADDGGIPTWLWIAGAGVLLVAGMVLALRLGGKATR